MGRWNRRGYKLTCRLYTERKEVETNSSQRTRSFPRVSLSIGPLFPPSYRYRFDLSLPAEKKLRHASAEFQENLPTPPPCWQLKQFSILIGKFLKFWPIEKRSFLNNFTNFLTKERWRILRERQRATKRYWNSRIRDLTRLKSLPTIPPIILTRRNEEFHFTEERYFVKKRKKKKRLAYPQRRHPSPLEHFFGGGRVAEIYSVRKEARDRAVKQSVWCTPILSLSSFYYFPSRLDPAGDFPRAKRSRRAGLRDLYWKSACRRVPPDSDSSRS